jgi:hypothetical protein
LKYCIIRRVAYRLPKTTRIVWANVLCERQGLALLHVPKPDHQWSHCIVLASEIVSERGVYEDGGGPIRFEVEADDMIEVGNKLRILGKSFSNSELRRLFGREDRFGEDD